MSERRSPALRAVGPAPAVLALVVVGAAVGCDPNHIQPYTRRDRDVPVVAAEPPPDPESEGSLYRASATAGDLFADQRAYRVADVVVVAVEERADAERTADTDIQRNSGSSLLVRAIPVIGALADLDPPDLNVDVTGEGRSDTEFRHEGKTGRTERLVATVPATVKAVLPNGNLVVEGHRVVLVNHEEQHLYVSGIVRPIDINEENTVKSSMIADAEIEFVGRGVVTDNSHQGWFSRTFGWWWPF